MEIPSALRSMHFDLTEDDHEFHQVIALQRSLRSTAHVSDEITTALLLLGRATLGGGDITEALANGRRVLREIHPSVRGTASKTFHRQGGRLSISISISISQIVKVKGTSVSVDTKLRNIGRDTVHVEGIRFGKTALPLSIILPPRNERWFGTGGGEVRIRFSERDEDSDSIRKENQAVTWILR